MSSFHDRILGNDLGGDVQFLADCGIDPALTAEEVADALLPEPPIILGPLDILHLWNEAGLHEHAPDRRRD